MLEQLKSKLQEEQTQRQILKGVGIVSTFVATQIFAHYMNMGVEAGIEAMMKKIHPTEVLQTAE
jgi:hypothetical protein